MYGASPDSAQQFPETVRRPLPLGGIVLDLVYVLLTIAFFALMLWYIAGCARLGHSSVERDEERKS